MLAAKCFAGSIKMSRIGKKAVAVPNGVTVTIDGQTVTVKGPKGQLSWTVAEEIEVRQENGELTLSKKVETTRAQAMWGLSRTLVGNMVTGVTEGYERKLELVGVGYRAALKGNALSLQLGFSHDVDLPPPTGISFAVPKQTEITVSGINKQQVGEIASQIRRIRPPEPYKGKGVRYAGEQVRRKEGKKK
jgi:large subunit ribosomal protein L6